MKIGEFYHKFYIKKIKSRIKKNYGIVKLKLCLNIQLRFNQRVKTVVIIAIRTPAIEISVAEFMHW